MLTRAGCEARQLRFREAMAARNIDAAVITDYHEVAYLTGLPMPRFPLFLYAPVLLYMETEGGSLLVSAMEDEALADERAVYDWHTMSTTNPDLVRQLMRAADGRLAGRSKPRRLGWQAESLPRLLGERLTELLAPDEWLPIDEDLIRLEKRKDADEVALLREAIACNLAAYDAASRLIAPGVNELAVLEAGHTAATLRAGEIVLHGGDYASGEMGGPARNRLVPSGEMYIVDAQTRYRGYWSDLSRAYPVSEPTPLQREVYNHVAEVLAGVPEMVQPGMHGTDLWHRLDARLREHPHLREVELPHHGGHGIGLRPHEAPDISRDRDTVFEVGDVICCEPGAYTPELHAGVRLENTFLITEAGLELLSDYPVLTL